MTRRSATQSPGLEPSGSPCVSTVSPREKSDGSEGVGETQGYLSERVTWRLGRYQDVLADVTCDAVIADPPFGERTHAAWREGERYMCRPGDRKRGAVARTSAERTPVPYAHWTSADVSEFVSFWAPRCRGWRVALTSHDLIGAWQRAYEDAGLYSFAPVPCVTWGGSIRLGGDGPSSWAVYAMVARPRERHFQKWGALPGAYSATVSKPERMELGGGGRGKPLDLMRAIVRDYSRPGALVCDPCGGLATTGVAALGMGRRFVGAEMDEPTYRRGRESLQAVVPVELFDPGRAQQAGLDLGLAPAQKTTRRPSKRCARKGEMDTGITGSAENHHV